MKVEIICTYCNHKVIREHVEVKNKLCGKCGDRHVRMKQLDEDKHDYAGYNYQGPDNKPKTEGSD